MVSRRGLFRSLSAVLPAAMLFLTVPEAEADPQRRRGKRRGRDDDWDDDDRGRRRNYRGRGSWRFRAVDRRAIYDYYSRPAGPPAFLRHPGPLPPGLRRRLYRSGTLPVGWQQHFVALDPVLCRRLPPVPVGYDRGFIGGNLVVVNRNTSILLDIVSFLE